VQCSAFPRLNYWIGLSASGVPDRNAVRKSIFIVLIVVAILGVHLGDLFGQFIDGLFRFLRDFFIILWLFIWIDNDTLGSTDACTLLVAPGTHTILATGWMLLPWAL